MEMVDKKVDGRLDCPKVYRPSEPKTHEKILRCERPNLIDKEGLPNDLTSISLLSFAARAFFNRRIAAYSS